jgi:hypothetical protein
MNYSFRIIVLTALIRQGPPLHRDSAAGQNIGWGKSFV